MNFFGVGPLELGLIIVVAVIFLGPERIPEVAVQVARAVKYLRGYATSATAQIREELDELTREYEEMRRELEDFKKQVRDDSTSISETARKAFLDEPIIEPGGEPPPAPRGKGRRNGA